MTQENPAKAMEQALEALENADRALHGAWQMLAAICENDPSRDRIAARDKALAAWERNGASTVALRSALAALPLPVRGEPPEGWKLVPVQPTPEMWRAGEDTFQCSYTGTPTSEPGAVWRAMLAAAPSETQPGEVPEKDTK